jgi:hypothetical protein
MDETKHTPGPWRASIGTLVRVVVGSVTICGVHKSGRFTGDHRPRETVASDQISPFTLEAGTDGSVLI